MNTRSSDIQRAKDYLVSVLPVAHTPDFIKERLGLGSSSATISRKLRAASVGINPEFERGYYRNEKGRDIAIYRANKGYKPQERPVKAPPAFFWFTLRQCPIASPMYKTIEAMKGDKMYSKGCRVWTGDHSKPILIDIDTYKS